jgi:hypothetical protein
MQGYYDYFKENDNKTQIGLLFCADEDIFDFFCNGTNNYTYYLTLNRTDSLTVIFYDLLEPLPIDPVASTLKVISKLNKDYDR